MTYRAAADRLLAAGLPATVRPFGLEVVIGAGDDTLRLQIGRASAGGDELSARLFRRPQDVRWFHRPSLDELIDLLVRARAAVGPAPEALFAALFADD